MCNPFSVVCLCILVRESLQARNRGLTHADLSEQRQYAAYAQLLIHYSD